MMPRRLGETSIYAEQTHVSLAIYNSIRYLDDVIGMEAELGVTYTEASNVIDYALVRLVLDSGGAQNGVAPNVAHP